MNETDKPQSFIGPQPGTASDMYTYELQSIQRAIRQLRTTVITAAVVVAVLTLLAFGGFLWLSLRMHGVDIVRLDGRIDAMDQRLDASVDYKRLYEHEHKPEGGE